MVTRAVLDLAPWLEETGRARLLVDLLDAAAGERATAAEKAELTLWSAIARAALGEVPAAAAAARRALAQARRCGAKRVVARALSLVGFHEREAGKPRLAVRKLEHALRLARAGRDRELEAETANRLALARWDLGDRDARTLFEE